MAMFTSCAGVGEKKLGNFGFSEGNPEKFITHISGLPI